MVYLGFFVLYRSKRRNAAGGNGDVGCESLSNLSSAGLDITGIVVCDHRLIGAYLRPQTRAE